MPYGYYGRCYGCDLLPPPIEWNIVEWIVIVNSGWAGGGGSSLTLTLTGGNDNIILLHK